MMKSRAVFLDRDGTLIRDMRYLRDPDQIAFVPGAVAALKQFRRNGFLLVVISNQSGIRRKIITPDEAQRVDHRFQQLLQKRGAKLDGTYYCPHSPADRCKCRKPRPGLILRAASDLEIDLRRSWMVGDKHSDVEAGRRAGCGTMLIDVAEGIGAWHKVARQILSTSQMISL